MDGPYVVVEQRVRNAERVSCPACIGIASRQRNRLDGFCELWGSKSQCDRAEPIRRRTLSQVDVRQAGAASGLFNTTVQVANALASVAAQRISGGHPAG